MKLRRLAALVSATVLALGMVSAVSATQEEKVTICHASGLDGTTKYETLTIGWPAVYGPGGHFNENGTPQAGHEQDYLGPCKEDEPSSEPNCNTEQQDATCDEPSSDPSDEASSEPSDEASSEPSDEASSEPSSDASEEPSDGEVEGLTSAPTLPPTDSLSSDSTNGPDGTLPLVLIVLGMIGLSAVVLTPVRTKR